MKGKIYIAGGMRGYPALNFKEFFLAEHFLEGANWEVKNPAAEDVENWNKGIQFEIKHGLLQDIKVLKGCEAIFMLRGWDKSEGAQCEYYYAKACGIKIYFQTITDAAIYGGTNYEPIH